jgi:iron-sulfur cluster assembly accessory protein
VITITDRAAEKIGQAITAEGSGSDGLRLRVVGGGCSGLQYKIDLDTERKGDKVFTSAGARVYVDRKSYLYLQGTVLDYREGLQNVGFELDNPNVTKTCGCGASFSV